MSEYIKREDVLEILEAYAKALIDRTGKPVFTCMAYDIRSLSAEDVVERKKGEWIEKQYVTMEGCVDGVIYNCSQCGKKATRYTISNYCPNCGAEMLKGGES